MAAGQGHPPSRLVIAKNEATEPERKIKELRRRGRSSSENKQATGATGKPLPPKNTAGSLAVGGERRSRVEVLALGKVGS